MSLFKRIFVITLIFTAGAWSMAWVFSAMAGETPKSTVKKLQGRLNEGQLVEEKETLDFKGIEKLTIETGATDVTAEAVLGDRGTIEYAGTVKPGGKMLIVKREGNELIVTLDQNRGTQGLVWNFGDDKDSPNLKVSTFMGLKISIPDNIAKNLKITVGSGDIKLKKISVDTMDISTSSGDVTLNDCAARQLGNVQTRSGDIEIHGFEGRLRTSSTSGEIDAARISGADYESVSTSGDIEIKEVKVLGLRAQATSGDISVSLPDSTGWKFSLSATSGEIKNDFSDDSKADKIMQIRSTSGDIRVRR